MSRRAVLVLLVLALAVLPAAGSSASPFEPPRDRWYAENDTGHFSDGEREAIDAGCEGADDRAACSLEAFRAASLPVIAFIDTGINPYHHDFRAPEFVHHPSTWIEGFPADVETIELSFDVADTQGYAAARAADEAIWTSLQRNRLYWFKGTRIVGGYSTGAGRTSGGRPERIILDDQGHGTGVASVAAGQHFGSNPEALIVAVEALGGSSLRWATAQPWIDVVSNSWGNIGNAPLGWASVADTRAATRRGQTVAFAAGNGATNTNSFTVFDPLPVDDPCKCKTPDSNPSFTSPYGGPSWVLTVGAASPINGQAHWWHSIPVDVSSFGSKWRAAAVDGVTLEENRDFGGTSCATPVTAGVLSRVIQTAREVLGDTTQGQRAGQPGVVAAADEGAELPAEGPLADGALTRAEAEELVVKTAFPVEAEPEQLTWDYAVRPTTPTYFAYQGYGVVDRGSRDRALSALLGESALPDRSDVDAYMTAKDAAKDAVWDRF